MSEMRTYECWVYNLGCRADMVSKAEADAVIAEKDKKIAELKEQYKDMDVTHTVHIAKMNARIEELEQKLQDQCMSCPVKMQYDDVVAEKDNEIRRLKRALWLARAERAHTIILLWNVYCYKNNSLYYRDFLNIKCNPFRNLPKKTAMEWSDLWETIEIKCRAKAEEYK